MKNKIWTVYCHTNKINGKRYIGITSSSLSRRFGSNGIGYRKQKYFYRAIEKYGWDGFTHDIVETGLRESEAKSLEMMYIALWQTDNKEYGYNLTWGGEGTKGLTGEKHRAYGTHLSSETKEKISKSLTGRKHTREELEKMSKSHLGIKLDEEHKKKLREANCKKVQCLDFEGVLITYESAKDFSQSVGVNYGTAKGWLNGRRKMPLEWEMRGLKYK